MKVVRYSEPGQRTPHFGILEDTTVIELDGSPYEGLRRSGRELDLGSIELLSPCVPSKIIAGGLNYFGHAREVNLPIPEVPVFFLKPPTSIVGHGEAIEYPPETKRLEFEAEFGVIIKHRMRNTSPENVLEHVLGYTCINDVTARDIQVWGGNYLHLCHSKSFETFCPAGPCIATDIDPNDMHLTLTVNGKIRQETDTNDMIFSVERMVSYFSHVMTLLPGDLVLMGTPAGIGPMDVGDTVEVVIDKIGTLTNQVIAKP